MSKSRYRRASREVFVDTDKMHQAQIDVLATKSQFNVLCCGRRWGKTVIGINRVVENVVAGRRKVGWFAPTYKLLGDAWRELDNVLAPIIRKRDAQDHRMEFVTGSSLECWTLDKPDAGRSRSYHEVIIDEAAMVSNLQAQWEEAILPTLTDYDGSAWFLSTPKGTASYFHKLYHNGQDATKPEWASWQMPSRINPFLKPSVITRFKGQLTDLAFAQEYLAEFVSWAGAVFRRIQDAQTNKSPGQTVMIGIDWARTGDYTVFTGLSAAGEVTEIDRFRGLEFQIQRDRLKAFWTRHGGRMYAGQPTAPFMIAETNSIGMPVVEQLQRDGLPVYGFETTNQSKAAIIQALALAFEREVIKIPFDPVLVGELQAFEAKKLPSGLLRYSAPDGEHDDCVMSLAMAWAGLLMPGGQQMYAAPGGGATHQYPGDRSISPV